MDNLRKELEHNQLHLMKLRPYRIQNQPDDIVGLQYDYSAKATLRYMQKDFLKQYGHEYNKQGEPIDKEKINHDKGLELKIQQLKAQVPGFDPSLPFGEHSTQVRRRLMGMTKSLENCNEDPERIQKRQLVQQNYQQNKSPTFVVKCSFKNPCDSERAAIAKRIAKNQKRINGFARKGSVKSRLYT